MIRLTGAAGQIVSRVAAVIVAAFAGWLLDSFGIEMTTEQIEGLTSGLTVLGGLILFFLYSFIRPLISRWISPKDNAEPTPKIERGIK